jgi:hypothetical protein
MVYANGDDVREVPFAAQCKGTSDTFLKNTVVSGVGQFYGACAQYSASDPDDHVTIDFNTFYSPNSNFTDGGCAGGKHGDITDFKKWQEAGLGQDQHSTLSDINQTDSSEILGAGSRLLGLEP